MPQPVLYALSGLPGVGKSTLARGLCRRLGAMYLRIDTLELALKELCSLDVHDEGYRMAYRLAADNLAAGVAVVADSCNPMPVTRHDWREAARRASASCIDIEVVCSDTREHYHRVEERRARYAREGLGWTPAWEDIERREYHAWQGERLRVDTAGCTPAQVLQGVIERLGTMKAGEI